MCKNNRGVRIKSGLTNRSKQIDSSASSLNYLCSSSSSVNCLCDHHHHNHHRNHKRTNNWSNVNHHKLSDFQVKSDLNRQYQHEISSLSSIFNTNQSTLNYKHYGLIALLSTLLYINSIDADFAYDDSRAIVTNHDLHPGTPWTNLLFNDFWGTPLSHSGSHKSYRPLTVLSFRLNYQLHSLSPYGYHATNVILYTLINLLWAHLTTYLFIADTSSCLIASLLFTSHPIHTESVAGIVGRADLLATLFFTISLISYIRYCYLKDYHQSLSSLSSCDPFHGRSQTTAAHFYLYMSLVTATCSMLSKEYGITVLGVNAVYHIAIHHKLCSHHALRNIKILFTEVKFCGLREGLKHLIVSAIILITGRLYMMGLSAPTFSPADNPAAGETNSLLTRTCTFLYLPCVNFGLLVYPYWLSFDWSMESIPLIKEINDSRNLISFTFYSILVYLTLQMYKYQSTLSSKELTLINKSLTSPSLQLTTTSSISLQHENDINHHQPNYSLINSSKVQNRRLGLTSSAVAIKNQISYNNNDYHWLSSKPFPPTDKDSLQTQDWSSSSSTSSCSSANSNDNGSSSVPTFSSASSLDDNICPTEPTEVTMVNSHSISVNCLIMALALLIIPFIPATNLLFYVGFVIAERILIIPSMGYSLLITSGLNILLQLIQASQWTVCNKEKGRKFLYGLLIATLIVFSVRTIERNKDWKSEEDLYRSGIAINPPKAYGNLANILSNKGHKLEAESAYRKALTYRSNMADVHYNLGILLQDQGRYHEALQSYTNAVKYRPRLALSYLNMGLVLSKLGRTNEAIKVYQHCTRLDGSGLKDPKTHESTRISAFFNLGQLYSERGDYEEAIKVFKEAIQRMPSHYQPQSLFNMLGEAYYKLGRYPEAEKWYKQALTIKRDHIPAHLTYAKLLAKWNRPEEAKQWFLKAEILAPNDSSVYQHYGQFLAEHGKYEEASDCFLKATRLSPNDYEIVFAAANILRQAGRNQEAERYYKEAVRLRPNEVTSHMNLGAMLHVNGKLMEAETSYLTALKLKPDDRLTQTNLAKLRHLLSSRRSIGS